MGERVSKCSNICANICLIKGLRQFMTGLFGVNYDLSDLLKLSEELGK